MAEVDFAKLRKNMVDCQIRTNDVTEHRLLDALLSVPREAFVPRSKKPLAYIDEDIELSAPDGDQPGRYLMEPTPLARLIQLAAIGSDDVVLDAGCATGYGAAVMSKLASSVIALDENTELLASATETLAEIGCDNVVTVEGRIAEGFASEAPYDVVFVGGAVDEIPDALFSQLKEGGRLVAVVGTGNAGVATLYTKADGHVSGRRAFNAAIRTLPGFQRQADFVF